MTTATPTADRVVFGKADIENVLAKMSDTQLNQLAFGAVEVDATGRILKYNATEGAITGRDPRAVIGRNFFTEVAPCTNRAQFKGVFDEGVKKGKFSKLFEYVFDHQMKPTRVQVHMKSSVLGTSYWIFVKRL